MIIPLSDSPHLDAIPELITPADAVVLSTSLYQSWDEMLAANPHKTDYILEAGDYRPWGVLTLRGLSGTPGRRRVIRFTDPTLHPLHRTEQALVERVDITHSGDWVTGSSHWIINGLTFTEPTTQALIERSSSHIVWSSNLHIGYDLYGIRVRLGAQRCTIQRCTFLDPVNPAGRDNVAVQFRLQDLAGSGQMPGHKVLDSEFRNCGDGVQVTDDEAFPDYSTDDLVIEGNDFYVTKEYYVHLASGEYAHAENGIDLKHGSRDAGSPLVIRSNRFWGYRYTDSPSAGRSNGACMTIHRFAENGRVKENVFFDAPIAWFLNARWPSGTRNLSRSFIFEKNWVGGIGVFADPDLGEIVWPTTPESFIGNVFSRSTTLAAHLPAEGGTTMDHNYLIGMPAGSLAAVWAGGSNSYLDRAHDLIVQTRRFTGPQWICLPNASIVRPTWFGLARHRMRCWWDRWRRPAYAQAESPAPLTKNMPGV
jgi:hypothetical protein